MYYEVISDGCSMSKLTSIRIESDLIDTLESFAKQWDRSRSWVINQALREFLEKQALEQKRWIETEEALRQVDAGAVVEAQSVHRWMDSWIGPDPVKKPTPER